jgi:methionyl-tRNA synthetase
MEQKNKFYVTTPIYYVTAKPHLGSLYSTILADVAARWNKLQGKKVFFLTGTDEHGQKIAEAAQKAGKAPQEFVDSFIDPYKDMWHRYHIEYNHFIRTTDEYHVKAVQRWIEFLLQKGDVYKSLYQGWYCTPCETFVTEKETVSSDTLSPTCSSCGRPTHQVSEETYFFRLSAYQDKLLQFYQQHPSFIIPKERLAEVVNFVKSGLKDLSISRTTITWGIPFPGDSNHVTYVWADALNNYITAVGYGQSGREHEFNFWWPADLHILGKDIVRFHAIYWPAFLMALGLPLPKHLLVHGWITVNKQKMSKSFGNVVDPEQLLNLYGADQVRYYLVRQMAINQDGDFSDYDLRERITADLANDLGNLLNRMVTLAIKYHKTTINAPGHWSSDSVALQKEYYTMLHDLQGYMQDYMYHLALACIWKFVNQVNAYFHAKEPWQVAKHDEAQFVEILSASVHSLYAIAIILWPVMPKKMEHLLYSLGCSIPLGGNLIAMLESLSWNSTFNLHQIEPLFVKPEPIQESMDIKTHEVVSTQTPSITIQDFTKVELMVGTIEQAQEVPKSNKLLHLQVNFGNHGMRQILSGIKLSYSPEELIGKQAIFVFNLEPRLMMGLESRGMLLTAEGSDGKVKIIMPSTQVPNGTKLK